MKNDELNVFGLREYNRQDFFDEPTDEIRFADRFYIMTEADAVLKGQQELIAEKDKEIAELKLKLEDANMENRRLKRALWLARAERSKTEYNHWILIWHCELNNHLFFINKTRYKNRAKVDRLHYPWEWRDIWDEVERKCRAKEEEYK